MKMGKQFAFTFGSNHTDADGASLGRSFVVLTNKPNSNSARLQMNEARGDKWSMQYDIDEFINDGQPEKYDLKEVFIQDIYLPKEMR